MMISLMMSMSSTFCSVSNQFLNSGRNSIFFDTICDISILGVYKYIWCIYIYIYTIYSFTHQEYIYIYSGI